MKTPKSSRGEISALIAIGSLVTILLGIIVGIQNTNTVKKLSGSAQTTCLYNTNATVRLNDENGPIVTTINNGITPWGISNDKQDQTIPALEFQTNAEATYTNPNFSFAPYKDHDRASVKLIGLNPNKYTVKDVFCTPNSPTAKGCDYGVAASADKLTINNFHITCDVDIKYGWVVEETSAPACRFNPVAGIWVENDNAPIALDPNIWYIVNDKGGRSDFITNPSYDGSQRNVSNIYSSPCKQPDGCIITTQTCCGSGNNNYAILPNGDTAHVTLHYDSDNYKILRQCRGVDSAGFPNDCSQVKSDASEIASDLPVACGRSYSYGWILENKNKPGASPTLFPPPLISPTPSPTISQTPTPSPSPTSISNPDPNPPVDQAKCTSYHNTGTGYRVLFVSESDNTKSDLLSFVNLAIDDVQNTNLGSLRREINYAYYDDQTLDFGCFEEDVNDASGGKGITCLKSHLAKLYRDTCGAQTVYIVGSKRLYGRSSAYARQRIIQGTINDPYAAAHELGHTIGQLRDEYSYGRSTASTVRYEPNCTSESSCSEWVTKYGSSNISCTPECSYDNWFRPTESSIMKTISDRTFNAPSFAALEQSIMGTTSFRLYSTEIDQDYYHNSYVLTINQNNENELTLSNISIKQIYPQKLEGQPEGDYYKINILNGSGDVLYTTYTEQSAIRTDVDQAIASTKRPIIYLSLPYFQNATTISLVDKNNSEKLVINLSQYKLSPAVKTSSQRLCGNNTCDISLENAISCPSDCKKTKSTLDAKQLLQNSDVDRNKSINAIDYALYIKNYGKTENFSAATGDINMDAKVNALDGSVIILNLSKKVD